MNNKFFQTVAPIRKEKNYIRKIKVAQGNWFDDQEGLSQVITKEFQKKFKVHIMINLL